jgi:hypothetical protein
VVEPPHFAFLMPLGLVGLCETARALDKMHGGFAKIACSRAH